MFVYRSIGLFLRIDTELKFVFLRNRSSLLCNILSEINELYISCRWALFAALCSKKKKWKSLFLLLTVQLAKSSASRPCWWQKLELLRFPSNFCREQGREAKNLAYYILSATKKTFSFFLLNYIGHVYLNYVGHI